MMSRKYFLAVMVIAGTAVSGDAAGLASRPDRTNPETSVSFDGPQVIINKRSLISAETLLALEATDKARSRQAVSGIQDTFVRVDSGEFQLYADAFFLPEGFHRVEFFSADRAGNREPVQSLDVFVDRQPPQTALTFAGKALTVNQETVLDEYTEISLGAEDPFWTESATSGLGETLYRVDGGTFTVFEQPFSLALGRHTVEFYSADRLGNEEPARVLAVLVEQAPAAEVEESAESWSEETSFDETLSADDGETVPRLGAMSAVSSVNGAFVLGEVYSFPNPAVDADPVIHAEFGLADAVSVRIFDGGGRLVHEADIPADPLVVNDGQGPQYAYEYQWDVSAVAPGNYFCSVHAKKQTESLQKNITLAVVK